MTNMLTNFSTLYQGPTQTCTRCPDSHLVIDFQSCGGPWPVTLQCEQVFGNGSIELVLQQLMKKETVDLKKKTKKMNEGVLREKRKERKYVII